MPVMSGTARGEPVAMSTASAWRSPSVVLTVKPVSAYSMPVTSVR